MSLASERKEAGKSYTTKRRSRKENYHLKDAVGLNPEELSADHHKLLLSPAVPRGDPRLKWASVDSTPRWRTRIKPAAVTNEVLITSSQSKTGHKRFQK